ncbi:MAG TPA: hypothetical protein VHO69_15245 [Phototrophicaceae bacterium]|nr:hypothetical protein [Phototrophicaceae bacterium]
MTTKTIMGPLGGELYTELKDRRGNTITLTYNDLWMLIVCRTSQDGDWVRTRQAASMVADATNKRALAEHLWELDQTLGGLPEIPPTVLKLHVQRAHLWFNQRPVLQDRNW